MVSLSTAGVAILLQGTLAGYFANMLMTVGLHQQLCLFPVIALHFHATTFCETLTMSGHSHVIWLELATQPSGSIRLSLNWVLLSDDSSCLFGTNCRVSGPFNMAWLRITFSYHTLQPGLRRSDRLIR